MSLKTWLFGNPASDVEAATQSAGGGTVINSSRDLELALASMNVVGAGVSVTPATAMRTSAVYASVRLISGTVANMPVRINRRIDERTREVAIDHSLTQVFTRRPNTWQTPSQFKRMLQAHVLLRGNSYAKIVRSRGNVIGLLPMHPDRVTCEQNEKTMALEYVWHRPDGGQIELPQSDVFHLVGMSLDGVKGVSPITFARESIGLALAQENHGAVTFKNGARPSNVLMHPKKLGKEGRENVRDSLDEYRAGGESDGKALILEEGMTVEKLGMTAEDAQWIESRKFSRTDIAMFFGVPPHMIGDTEPSTSWGSGLEQQSTGYVTYTAEDHLTMWEESIARDLLKRTETDIYARFQRKSLVRGDIKTRWTTHVQSVQWGLMSPNEIRALEDMNPRDDGEGDQYYDPPNTAGDTTEGDDDDSKNTAGSAAVPAA